MTIDCEKGQLIFGDGSKFAGVKVPYTLDAKDRPTFCVRKNRGAVKSILLDTGTSFARIKPALLNRITGKASNAGTEIAFSIRGAEPTALKRITLVCANDDVCAKDSVIQLGSWQALGGSFFGSSERRLMARTMCFIWTNTGIYLLL